MADEPASPASPSPERPAPPDDGRGDAIVRASWLGTAVFALVSVATLVAAGVLQLTFVLVSVGLFVVGFLAFAAAYVIAIGRSREELIGMGGLYFLAGTAPRRVRNHLMASLAAQCVVAIVASSIGFAAMADDATNPLAFGYLVPLYGLGMAGLWGARYGTFAPRTDQGPA